MLQNHLPTLYLFLLLIPHLVQAQVPTTEFKVMAWNILHGARDIDRGVEHAITIIKEVDPDVVLMVETYGSGPKIAEALGMHFHLVAPADTEPDDREINLSIFSRYPFGERLDSPFPFYLGGREIRIGEQPVRFLVNWFHYLPMADEPETLGDTPEALLEWEKTGQRVEMIQQVLPYLKTWAGQADSIPLVLGGDMNSPSHLDWGPETRHLHNGLIVPWYATKVLADLGFVDSFREVHPDPIAHPGITWNKPDRKDEHRIDYIYYKSQDLEAVSSTSAQAFLGEPLKIGDRTVPFPSDHGFVVTTFRIGEN